jgi:hypothetical protein
MAGKLSRFRAGMVGLELLWSSAGAASELELGPRLPGSRVTGLSAQAKWPNHGRAGIVNSKLILSSAAAA